MAKMGKVASFMEKCNLEARRLLPAYFAMVMATGIVSIALHDYGMIVLSEILFYIDAGGYVILWILSADRLLMHRQEYLHDLKDHSRAPGFFTIIAGTNTLGSAFFVVGGSVTFAFYLWVFGVFLWIIYQYVVFSFLTIVEEKPTLDKAVNGVWLVAVVSTQSVAVLAAQLSAYHTWMYLISVLMYMIGWVTYFMIMAIVNYRLFFFRIEAKTITGPYWINMGATAITTLAGSLILLQGRIPSIAAQYPLMLELLPFITGATLLIWAYGSWWIPWLFIMGLWRHSKGKVSILAYDPAFWGAVFPMGMYTVSTYMLIKSTGLTELHLIPDVFVFIALLGWLYQFSGMLYGITHGIGKSMKVGESVSSGS